MLGVLYRKSLARSDEQQSGNVALRYTSIYVGLIGSRDARCRCVSHCLHSDDSSARNAAAATRVQLRSVLRHRQLVHLSEGLPHLSR